MFSIQATKQPCLFTFGYIFLEEVFSAPPIFELYFISMLLKILERICPHSLLPFDNPSAEMEWHEWQCVLKYTEMGTIEFNLMLLERCRL